MFAKILKLLKANNNNKIADAPIKTAVKILIGVLAAVIFYELAAQTLGRLVMDDQTSIGWLDNNWVLAIITYLFCILILIITYRLIKKDKHWRLKQVIRSNIKLLIFLALIIAAYLFVVYSRPSTHTKAYVDAIWLPDTRTSDEDALSLPGSLSAGWQPLYGKTLRFHGAGSDNYPFTFPITVYEARPNAWLKASHCPNLSNVDEIVPQDCQQIGMVHGYKVYAISRSLPGAAYQVYTQFDSTFIYFNQLNGGDKYALEYLRTFRQVSPKQLNAELKSNKIKADTLRADYDYKYKTLAQRLPFNTLLSIPMPTGWFINGDMSIGPDIYHPRIEQVDYTDGQGHSVQVTVLPATDFKLQTGACGPLPYTEVPLTCNYVPGQNFYYANEPGTQHRFRQNDDTVTITTINLKPEDYKVPGKVIELLETADQFGINLKPANKSALPKVSLRHDK